jgi:hypothetical protein
MADQCAGVTATWNSTAFGEVTDIKVAVGGGLPLARGSTAASMAWAFDAGTIEIACLQTANIAMTQFGKKATLGISGGGLTFTTKAICQSLQLAGKVNDVARYAATFKIVLE